MVFAALCGNFAAMNIQMFIRGWLVFEITGSYEKLGWMTAAGGLVGLVAAPLGGVVADRVKQKKTILQLAGMPTLSSRSVSRHSSSKASWSLNIYSSPRFFKAW